MKKNKKHQINTVQDMIKCTNKNNLDNFLIDLKNVIKTAHFLQDFSNVFAENMGMPKKYAKIESAGFEWIDDGEHNI